MDVRKNHFLRLETKILLPTYYKPSLKGRTIGYFPKSRFTYEDIFFGNRHKNKKLIPENG